MKAIDIRSVRTVFDGHSRIDEAEVRYELPDGQMSEPAKRTSFERGDSAAALIVNLASRSVGLVPQLRYPTVARGPGWVLEVVAGVFAEGGRRSIASEGKRSRIPATRQRSCEASAAFYTSPGGSLRSGCTFSTRR